MPSSQRYVSPTGVLTLVLLLLCAPSIASAQTYVFNAAKIVSAHNPQAVVVTDFDNEGTTDLAVANYDDNTVSVFLGRPGGMFRTKVDYAVGINPVGVAAGDVNGDGKPDLIVVNQDCPSLPCASPGSVSVLLGRGNGTFLAQKVTTVGNAPAAVAAADFNGDGKLDVVVTNSQDNTVSLLVGNNTGVFHRNDFNTSFNPKAVVIGDFNGDGKLDAAVANKGRANVSILLGNGDGTLQGQILQDTGPSPNSIVAGDFNGDGKLDIATADTGSSQVSVLLGIGDGTFQPHTELTIEGPGLSVTSADFDGDGHLDLAATSATTNSVSVLLGRGNGTFRNHVDYAAGIGPNYITTGDINSDGQTDLVIVNSTENSITLLPGIGKGGFQSATAVTVGQQPVSVALGDFNRDGNLDAAVANAGDNTVSVFLGKGTGGFRPATILPVGSKPSAVAVADLNGDTFFDLVVANSSDATVSVILGNGDGTFQPTVKTFGTGTKPVYVIAADFNRDNVVDLAVVNQVGQSITYLEGIGNGTYKTGHSYACGANTLPLSAVAGVFTASGRLDLACIGTGNGQVELMANLGDGVFALPKPFPVGLSPIGAAVGDFNGDGINDLAVANNKSASVSVLLGTAPGFAAAVNYPTGFGPSNVVAADLNGDGKTDLAVSFSTASIDNGVSVLAGKGDGTFQLSVDHATKFVQGSQLQALAVGDFNNDLSPDLITADQAANLVTLFLNTSLASPAPPALDFGTQAENQPSPPKNVNLVNSGSSSLTVFSVVASGDYSQTNTCTDLVEPGSSCSISVVFTPHNLGTSLGSITITDDSPSKTQVVSLSGEGTIVKLTPTSVTFGNQTVGTQSSPQDVTVANIGSQPVSISSVSITGVNAGDFSQTNNCPTTLVGGASCTVTVTFTPTATGVRSASVSVVDDGGGSPQTAALSGTGT